MRNLLVTGGAGFIGSNFVRYWLEKHADDHIVVLDALTYAGNASSLEDVIGPRCELVRGSITDGVLVQSLLRERRIDIVVNLAAESSVDRSIADPELFVETNIVGTHTLLSACRRQWLDGIEKPHRFHHVSTDEVFGMLAKNDPPFTEQNRYAPSSPYAASKAAADHLVLAYKRTYGLQVSLSSCSNNYGPYHFPEKLIPRTIVNLLTGKDVPIYGTGEHVRDWLHVRDHCAALEAILTRGREGDAYNIGGRCERTNLEVVDAIARLIDAQFAADPGLARRFPQAKAARGIPSASSIVRVGDRPGHDFRYAMDATKIETELGFACAIPFDEGLEETVRWYIDHETWWRPLVDVSSPLARCS